MKFYRLFVLLALVSGAATAANATELKCGERASTAQVQKRLQYAVFINSTGQIKDPKVVGKYDFAEGVKVQVVARNPEIQGSKYKPVKPAFAAIAKSEDVMYRIESWTANGFKMEVYMDEIDQTTVKLKGIRGEIRMKCAPIK